MTPFLLWLLATLASYRLWRLLALDEVLASQRIWFVEHLPPKYEEAIYCSWCLGFWCCVVTFVTIDYLGYSIPLPLVQIAASSSIVGWVGARVD